MMNRLHCIVVFCWFTVVVGGRVSADEKVHYLKQIKAILSAKCYSCHGALKQKGELRLETRPLMLKGGDNGEVMGTVILLTSDPFEKVLAYYEKQMGGKLGSDSDETAGFTSAKLTEGFISNDDSKKGVVDDGKSPPRDVRLVTLTKVDKEHVTTLILSRAKTDMKTHIVLTWIRR